MANLFDAANAREGEPIEFVIGDLVQWKRSDFVVDYPPAQYTAAYVARLETGGASDFTVTGTDGGDHYLFTITSTTSAGFTAGYYGWQLEITQNATGNRIVLDASSFRAISDIEASQADFRSHAEIMVGKIESILEGKADADVSSYSIAGRSITKMSFEELTAARNMYRGEVAKEKNRELLRRGKSTGSTIKVRFR
jgi:hypothetical protein